MSNTFSTIKYLVQLVAENQGLHDAIENHVKFVSQTVHYESHVVLLTAIHSYYEMLPFPEIKTLMCTSKVIGHCNNPY